MPSKSRYLSTLIDGNGSIKTTQIDSDAIGTSAAKSITAASGTDIYSSADTLPVSADNGDQALVTSTNRLYIYSNGGWYNIALINSTPYWITEADGSYALSTTGGATIIEILAGDSDGTIPSYTATTDSDFNQIATITQDSDSRWIVTPTDSENGTAIAGTGTITFKATDGVNLVSTLSTFSLTFITAIENSAETTLLLKADTTGTDNQADASTNNHTITENGNVTSTAFSPYHPGGYSTYFDGSGDYLDISSSNNFIFGTGAFTVECWFYSTDLNHKGGTQYPHLICINSYTNGVYLRPHYNGTSYNVYVGGTSYTFSTTIEENVWTHVAVVRDGSGNLKLFENGIQIGSTVTGVNYNISTNSSNNRIGSAIHTSGEEFKGYIKDVRVTNTAVYTTNFTSPTETLTAIANTQLLTCHLPYIADGSSNNHTITIVGNTSTKRFSPYDYNDPYTKTDHSGSVYFDGSGDYLVPAITTAVGTSDFTLEGWFYLTSTAADTTIFDFRSSSNWGIFSVIANNTVCYYNGSSTVGVTSNTVTDNTWNHIAIVRNSGSIKIYINGVLGSTTADATNWTLAASPRIGGNKGNVAWMNGYIADVRFVSGTAVYTADFTPPTEPLTAITNTELLTCTNKNDIWDASTGNLLTKAGNITSSDTQRQFTTSSAIYFDGAGDRITVPYSQLTSLGSGDFTVEWWMRPTANATMRPLGFDSNSAGTWIVVMYSGGTFDIAYAESPVFSSASSYSSGTWQHIAWTRSGSISRLFIDGILDKTNNSFTYDFDQNTSHALQIGYNTAPNSSQAFNGYLQDLRITRGVARYTSNFTPPTAEFEG
jgi:hypothetical protein